eukprot:TRINITY_DN21438_c0_g1_i1.p1 TRINITY_DN21438_c0_g1~~TRINITY_DN21438_c0_g1_i1.p1  ORF type:complete len:439 (-),score=84.68 TRINITY_DN21438_c0_g1_i1:196-1512(-)
MAPIGQLGPKPWRRERLQGIDTRLASSILKAHVTTPRMPKHDKVASSYHWRPVQLKEHPQQMGFMSYSVGTYVETLTMHIANETYADSTSRLLRLESTNFTADGSLWCYLVGGCFVICKGQVVGHGIQRGMKMLLGRLPVECRPRSELRFAALSREAYDVGGHIAYTSHLVTLFVGADGYVHLVSSRETEGAIDLSAIRFCIEGGISLIDGVSLHTVDVGGTRLVTLQGTLTDRFHTVHSAKPLALLPESCRPPRELPFITSGRSAGGFHLLVAKPSYDMGCGGELFWRDSIWNHDQLHLTGLMYEVAADARQISTLSSRWTGESLQIFVKDFQNFLIRKFGTIEAAWFQAFDTDGSGSVNFTEFGLGCKASGYVGNATRLWAALDEDRSGEISIEEMHMGMLAPAEETATTLQMPALEAASAGGRARTALPGQIKDG